MYTQHEYIRVQHTEQTHLEYTCENRVEIKLIPSIEVVLLYFSMFITIEGIHAKGAYITFL